MIKYFLICCLLFSSCKTTQSETNHSIEQQDVSFEVILESATDGKKGHSLEVINTASQLAEVYNILSKTIEPKHQIPEIDFNSETVAALFLGEKNTGGYHIVPMEVINENDTTIIKYKEISPAPTDMVTMSLTQPFCLIKIYNPKKEIVFKKVK